MYNRRVPAPASDPANSNSKAFPAVQRANCAAILARLALLSGLGAIAIMAAMVVAGYSSAPFWDQWQILQEIARERGSITLHFLWAQHNEHRLLFPKLFYVADLYLFGGKNIFLLAGIFLFQLLHLGIWIFVFRKFARLTGEMFYLAIGATAFCLFFPSQFQNFTWGMQVCFILPMLAAAAALAALAIYGQRERSHTKGARDYLLLALFCAGIASFSLASGLLTWPAMLLAAIALRLRARIVATIVVLGITAFAIYFQGLQSHSAPLAVFLHQPGEAAKYFLNYLAAPWESLGFAPALRLALAAAAVLAMVFMIAKMLLHRRATALQAFALPYAAYCMGCALLTTAGRLIFGAEHAATSRYQTVALVFWLCAGALFFEWLAQHSEISGDALAAIAASMLVIMLVALSTVPPTYHWLTHRSQDFESATLALAAGVPDISLAEVVPDGIALSGDGHTLWLLRNLHAWIYSEKFYRKLGQNITSSYQFAGPNACRGALEMATPIAGELQRGSRVAGWATLAPNQQPAEKILLASGDGTVLGFARGRGYGQPFLRLYPSGSDPSQRWYGFIAGLAQPERITAYAVLPDGNHVCALAGAAAVPVQFKTFN